MPVVDTGVLVGAFHVRDAHHNRAFGIVRAADRGEIAPLIIPDMVLCEIMNYIVRKGNSAMARQALQRIEASDGFRIERLPDTAWIHGKDRVFQEVDGLSLVDALVVAFMRGRNIKQLYSFDSGFDRVPGIERLEEA